MVTGALLFLLGTINTFTSANPLKPTEIIIEKHSEPKFDSKLTNYGLPGYPPFISNFMEHGTNVFFKPQIMLSPIFTPEHQVIFDKDCNKFSMAPAVPFAPTPEFVIDEPVNIIDSIISGAEKPTVNKIVAINPPVISEELVEIPVSSPIVQPEFAPLTIIPEPINDGFQSAVIEEVKPASITDAPEVPPISGPEVPLLPPAPIIEPVSFVDSHDNTMLHVLEAPELPPYLPPKLPLPIVMTEVLIECDKQNKSQQFSDIPILVESQPSVMENVDIIIPSPPAGEILVSQTVLEEKLENIPLAPILPEIQESIIMNIPISEINMSHLEQENLITTPSPPKLPPMSIMSLPVNVALESISAGPENPLFVESKPLLIDNNKLEEIEIPAPPVLLPISPVSLPDTAIVSKPIIEAPELPPMDEPKPILIEENKFESIEIPPAPVLPPMAPINIAVAPAFPEVMTNEITIVEVPEHIKPVPVPEIPLLTTQAVAEEITIQKETLSIPVLPGLPPFPSIPILMEQPMPAMYSTAEIRPILMEEINLPQPLSNKPLFMTFAQPSKLPISEVESIISFPTSCVQNIVVERVLPNIVREGKLEIFSSSNYPVVSSYSPLAPNFFMKDIKYIPIRK